MATLVYLHITATTVCAIWVAGTAIAMEEFGAAAEVWNATADARKEMEPEITGRGRGSEKLFISSRVAVVFRLCEIMTLVLSWKSVISRRVEDPKLYYSKLS